MSFWISLLRLTKCDGFHFELNTLCRNSRCTTSTITEFHNAAYGAIVFHRGVFMSCSSCYHLSFHPFFTNLSILFSNHQWINNQRVKCKYSFFFNPVHRWQILVHTVYNKASGFLMHYPIICSCIRYTSQTVEFPKTSSWTLTPLSSSFHLDPIHIRICLHLSPNSLATEHHTSSIFFFFFCSQPFHVKWSYQHAAPHLLCFCPLSRFC